MKKKLLVLIIGIIFLFPYKVFANIVCNDGTVSPSCGDCHTGCCSRHGGCSNYSSQSQNNVTTSPQIDNSNIEPSISENERKEEVIEPIEPEESVVEEVIEEEIVLEENIVEDVIEEEIVLEENIVEDVQEEVEDTLTNEEELEDEKEELDEVVDTNEMDNLLDSGTSNESEEDDEGGFFENVAGLISLSVFGYGAYKLISKIRK